MAAHFLQIMKCISYCQILSTDMIMEEITLLARLFQTIATKLVCLTVYPKKYAHGFVVLCFVVVMQSFIMNSHEVFIHIHQCCFAGTGAIVRLPQCQWSKPYGYGKISQYITTTKHSKAKTACIFLGIYCSSAGKLHTELHWHVLAWVSHTLHRRSSPLGSIQYHGQV